MPRDPRPTRPSVRHRRRRAARPLDAFPTPDRPAAPDYGVAEAERLVADLAALIDAGLVTAIDDGAQPRYAATGRNPEPRPTPTAEEAITA